MVKNEFIFVDHEKFRNRLQIQDEFFTQLKKSNDLSQVIRSPENQDNGESVNLNEIFSVMNGLGQLSFAIMVAVHTTGWTPGSMELLRTEGMDIDSILDGLDKLSENQSPVHTDSLLGLMAWEILELLIYPCLKIAYADGDFSLDERKMIIKLLSEEWGYHQPFIENLITKTEPKLDRFNYEDFTANIREICKIFPEINYEESRDELVDVVRRVVLADGFVHPNEQKEMDGFIDQLSLDEKPERTQFKINNLWAYIFKDDDSDKDIKVTDILRKVPVFEHLTRRELKTISKLVHSRLYQPGEYMFHKDQPGAAMYIIKKGTINVVLPGADDTEIHLAELKTGTFVGELALLDNSPRSASAKAGESTEVLAFFRSELNKLLKTHPSIGSKIMRQLALIIGQRLTATNDQLYKK
ncbi:MAG: cyclic nucleotide-binding domain-containing protein [Proteobacteria bacterium]|nr:cyclic nucleotide-binding domain-containing protein [Pseudomonadota bacterium]